MIKKIFFTSSLSKWNLTVPFISFIRLNIKKKKSNISKLIKYIQKLYNKISTKICSPSIHVKSL